MDRTEVTKFLGDLLISKRFTGMGKYWANEVTLDYGQGIGKVKRVDFMQFIPENQISVAGIEKGEFVCYEIKSCEADFKSGHGLNFEGERNYIVTTMKTYKSCINEMNRLPRNVGVMVACPCTIDVADEFINPTPVKEKTIVWDLKIVKNCFKGYRTRSMAELLFCMLRSGK